MVNQQILAGNWNDLKGRLKKKWGQLTNDDVQSFDGNVDRLIGMIQSKTGEARNSIERFLDELTRSGSKGVSGAAESVRETVTAAAGQVRDYAGQAASAVNSQMSAAAETFRDGYQDVEQVVKKRPGESVAVCFGAGIVAGLLLALTMRR